MTLEQCPDDFDDPEWDRDDRVHNWRNYPSDEVKALWPTFTRQQKIALAAMFDEMAGREEWE